MATMAILAKSRMRSQSQPRDFSSGEGRDIMQTGGGPTKKRVFEGVGMYEEPGRKLLEYVVMAWAGGSRERAMARRVQSWRVYPCERRAASEEASAASKTMRKSRELEYR